MNANELKLHLDNCQDESPCADNDIVYVTLPLMRLSQNLFSKIDSLLESEYQLTHSELDVLASLHSSEETQHTLSPTKLYEKLVFSSGGMTKVLKKLTDKEFILRLDNKEDKRSKLVQLTPKGKEILVTSLNSIIEMEEKMFSHVNKEDRKALSNLLFSALKKSE